MVLSVCGSRHSAAALFASGICHKVPVNPFDLPSWSVRNRQLVLNVRLSKFSGHIACESCWQSRLKDTPYCYHAGQRASSCITQC